MLTNPSGEAPSGPPGTALVRLVEIMRRLRVECPWDAKQTHASLAPHLLEETYEALEAVEAEDLPAMRDELGDVLIQVIFHAGIASERTDGAGFTIDDVAEGTIGKLVRRHPHVFGDVKAGTPEEVKRNWDAIKAAERAEAGQADASAMDSVPFGQPALALASQLQRRAERAGAPPGLAAEAGPASGVSEVGAELFALAAKASAAGLDPELELRAAARAYATAVRAWEKTRIP